jgi:alpha-amylase
VWNNLVALEARLDALQPRPITAAVDLDFDGKIEVFAHNGALQIVLRDDGLGAAHELDSYPLAHNFADTLRRYPEHYHGRIGNGETRHEGEGIASAHDIVRFKHPVATEDIVPDELPRVLWLDEIDGMPVTDYRLAPEALRCERAGVVKSYVLEATGVTVTWRLSSLAGRSFATRLNLAMPSCDGFLGRYILADGRIPGGFGQPLELAAAMALTLEDGVLGAAVRITTGLPAEISSQAFKTVSQSEAGFEKIMQAVEVCVAWTVPDDECTLKLHLTTAASAP